MHSLATVHARDNQRRHDTAYLNKRLFYWRKVRRLKILMQNDTLDRHYVTLSCNLCQKQLNKEIILKTIEQIAAETNSWLNV